MSTSIMSAPVANHVNREGDSLDCYFSLSQAWFGDDSGAELVMQFEEACGRLPVSAEEVNSFSEFGIDPAPVAVVKPTPIAVVKPAPVAAPLTPPASRNLFAMTKAGVREAFVAHFGVAAPVSYTKQKLIAAIDGTFTPRGHVFKAAMKAQAEAKLGAVVPKSWTAAKLTAYVNGTGKAPQTAVAKAALVAQVTEKFGACPKSYSAQKCQAVIDGTVVPRIGGKRADGMTADVCKKLLSDARKGGMTVPAYSALKADELRALCATLNLSVSK